MHTSLNIKILHNTFSLLPKIAINNKLPGFTRDAAKGGGGKDTHCFVETQVKMLKGNKLL